MSISLITTTRSCLHTAYKQERRNRQVCTMLTLTGISDVIPALKQHSFQLISSTAD